MTIDEFIHAVRDIVKDQVGFRETGSYFEWYDNENLHVVCNGNSFNLICEGLSEYYNHRNMEIGRSLVIKMLSNQVLMRAFRKL